MHLLLFLVSLAQCAQLEWTQWKCSPDTAITTEVPRGSGLLPELRFIAFSFERKLAFSAWTTVTAQANATLSLKLQGKDSIEYILGVQIGNQSWRLDGDDLVVCDQGCTFNKTLAAGEQSLRITIQAPGGLDGSWLAINSVSLFQESGSLALWWPYLVAALAVLAVGIALGIACFRRRRTEDFNLEDF